MDELNSFYVEIQFNNEVQTVEVKPCCQEDDIFYYDILINNQYQFTITPSTATNDGYSWRMALKNADKIVDPGIIQLIGEQIDAYHMI